MATMPDSPLETVDEQNRSTEERSTGNESARKLREVETPATVDSEVAEDQEKSREEEEAAARTAQRKSLVKKFAPLVLVVAAVGVLLWWLHARRYETTDDAQIDGHISQIGSRVSGYVAKVYVEDNQEVQPGQVLAEIDPRDYEVALARATAEFADSQAQAAAATYNVPITSIATASQIDSAHADLRNAQSAVASAQKAFDAARAKEQA